MPQVTKQQLTSYKQVTAGDSITCERSHGYDWLLTVGKEYKVIRAEPNPFGMYQSDCVTVTSDDQRKEVTAHITRFSKQIKTAKKGTN